MIPWLIWIVLCPALAGDRPEIALLPLEAPAGTESRTLEVLTRGLAAAIEAEGRLRPVVDAEIEARLDATRPDRLREARDSSVEGRRLLTAGDTAFAIVFLQEAVAAFEEVAGEWAFRREQADAWYALARAQAEMGDRPAAVAALARTLALVPDHLETGADAYDPNVQALYEDAAAWLAAQPPHHLSPAAASRLSERLDTLYLVEGQVAEDGELQLTVFDGAAAVHRATRPGPVQAGRIGDPYYDDLAAELVAASLRQPLPTASVLRPQQPISAGAEGPRSGGRWILPVLGSVVAAGTASVVIAATWPEPPDPIPTWSLIVELP